MKLFQKKKKKTELQEIKLLEAAVENSRMIVERNNKTIAELEMLLAAGKREQIVSEANEA